MAVWSLGQQLGASPGRVGDPQVQCCSLVTELDAKGFAWSRALGRGGGRGAVAIPDLFKWLRASAPAPLVPGLGPTRQEIPVPCKPTHSFYPDFHSPWVCGRQILIPPSLLLGGGGSGGLIKLEEGSFLAGELATCWRVRPLRNAVSTIHFQGKVKIQKLCSATTGMEFPWRPGY